MRRRRAWKAGGESELMSLLMGLRLMDSIPPKDIIEGPPNRLCPILLRQTSFKALTEPILFAEFDSDDGSIEEEAVAEDFAPGSMGSVASARTAQSSRRGSGGEMGSHRARFGEIESRGAALTPKGECIFPLHRVSAGIGAET